MPTTKALLNTEEKKVLWRHLLKHKAYPYRFRVRQTINAANFATTDGAIGSYFTKIFTPDYATGIVGIACGFIITPNSTTGEFHVVASYRNTVSLANLAGNIPDEGTEAYSNISNGGAVNDFQVYFPLNIYVEAKKPFHMHFWADQTTVNAGTSTLIGHFTLWTLPTDIGG